MLPISPSPMLDVLPCAPDRSMESRRIRRTVGRHRRRARRSINCTRVRLPRSPSSSRGRAISRLCSPMNGGSSAVPKPLNSSRPTRSESTARSSGTSASSSGNDLKVDRERRAVGRHEREAPFARDGHERLRNEGHDQDCDRGDPDELSPRVEARQVIEGRRMPHPEYENQESEQEPTGVEEAQSKEDQDRRPGQVELAAPEERPRDVAAVELPRGQQVDRGHEQSDPARERERVWMAQQRLRQREEQRQGAEQKRRLRLPRQGNAGGGGCRGQRESRQGHGDRDREADERSGYANVQQSAAIRDRVSHADKRAERAEGRDGRQEERKGRLHFVSLRDEIVPHFMGAEDRQQGKGEEQATEPD